MLTKRCPSCREKIPDKVVFCPHCGYSFKAEKKKNKYSGCVILIAILALLVYIASVFICLPGLLITQFIFGISLKMGNFWLLGVVFSGAIYGILYLISKDPSMAGKVYLGICIVLLMCTYPLYRCDSLFYKKLIYNTWYWEFIEPIRKDFAREFEKLKVLKEPPIFGFVNAKSANVRKGPGMENEVITTLHKGYKVRILIPQDDWILIQYDSIYEGWMHKSLLKLKDSLETKIK
uniref:Zinc-ribbon domain-containing protein n=1 Tax=candidate division WOR-3 bacterium TaxID=2052148 RepID=A0A7V1EJ06_UNCW3